MRRFATRCLVLASALLAAGCVTRGTFERVEGERNALAADKRRLEERVRMLQASAESLDSERVALIEEMEALRQAHDALDSDVRRLRQAERELSEDLSRREQELQSRSQEVDRLKSTYEGLVADLESEVAAGQITIQQLRDGLRLDLQEDVLFASGSAEVNPRGQTVLGKVAERMKSVPHRVEVGGHTDDVPIHTARFASNWELASARATGVVRILAKRGVDPTRLSAVSFGEFAPVAENGTPQGRARNRRIEITLKPVAVEAAQRAAGERSAGRPAPRRPSGGEDPPAQADAAAR
jgi:chemotaxis protein MotB